MSTMTMSTHLFHVLTRRDADAVWRVLTESEFYGAPMTSDWEVGSTVELGSRLGGSIVGEVIVTEPGVRLVHTFGDALDQPSVYVTWSLHSDAGGTIVRLYVDDLEGTGDRATDEMEAERAWLPVLQALQGRLDRLPAL